MTVPGFYFAKLELRGRAVEPASLELKKGLNVISGASATGKSYILQCLNYMTGSTTPPKSVAESEGYETAFLEICSWEGEVFTLERSLRGGDIGLYRSAMAEIAGEVEREVLRPKRSQSANRRSISEFLLELTNMDDVKLRTNANGKVRPASFRDVAHLAIIGEEHIYTEASPIWSSGQFIHKTVEESYFKYILTGVDDSSVIKNKDDAKSATRRQGRLDALYNVLEGLHESLAEFSDAPEEVAQQLERTKTTLEELTSTVAFNRQELRQQQSQRKEYWERLQNATARREVFGRLIDRFSLLEQHYDSDLYRLRATAEAGEFLVQLPEVACPTCGNQEPWGDDARLVLIQTSCNQEVERIQLLKDDLTETVSDIEAELESTNRIIARTERSLSRIDQRIETDFLPAEELTKDELSELLESRRRLERAASLLAQIETIRSDINKLESMSATPRNKATQASGNTTTVKTSETDEFCQVVEKILAQWKFPDLGRVTFSEELQDLVINGKDRRSHGKGVRALSYAAFVIGVQRYCRARERPHPGFIVLDSPLVAYREPDSQSSMEKAGVKEHFYTSLSSRTRNTQVVVFENLDPPEALKSKIAFLHFTGDKDGKGRSGFFPAKKQTKKVKPKKRK